MEKPQNTTINRGSTTTGPVSATLADLATSGRSGTPGPGIGRYRPMKTGAISEFPSTPDTFFCLEESIGDMPLSTIGCGMDYNLIADGHKDVDNRSHWCSHILVL